MKQLHCADELLREGGLDPTGPEVQAGLSVRTAVTSSETELVAACFEHLQCPLVPQGDIATKVKGAKRVCLGDVSVSRNKRGGCCLLGYSFSCCSIYELWPAPNTPPMPYGRYLPA